MNEAALDKFNSIAAGLNVECCCSPLADGCLAVVPGQYDSSDLLRFCGVPVSPNTFTKPFLDEQTALSIKNLANSVFVHSRMKRCSRFSGYESLVRDLAAKHFPAVALHIEDMFDVRIKLELPKSLPRLDLPYGYKGGAARMALSYALGLAADIAPRDLDIIRIGSATAAQDDETSKRYMYEDYARNNRFGVEVVSGDRDYFRSRDLSINEVFLHNSELRLTLQCLLDTTANVIRPSAAHYKNHTSAMKSIVASKALRLLADRTSQKQKSEIVYFGVDGNREIKAFDIGVHLKRAAAVSKINARLFLAATAMTAGVKELPWRESAPNVITFLKQRSDFPEAFFDNLHF